MITLTPKVTDVSVANDSLMVWVGNHGHTLSISELKRMIAKTRHEEVTQDMVYFICVLKIITKATSLGILPKDMTGAQIKSAIEVSGDI